jgi:hypothetical protein
MWFKITSLIIETEARQEDKENNPQLTRHDQTHSKHCKEVNLYCVFVLLKTKFTCSECDVAVCGRPCFDIYHSKQYF